MFAVFQHTLAGQCHTEVVLGIQAGTQSVVGAGIQVVVGMQVEGQVGRLAGSLGNL